MTPIDPKLIALAKSLRPDLAQRLIVMKATEAGRGILIKPAGRPPMPAQPPLPATPDPAAAKVAVLPHPAPGIATGPQSVALTAYVEEGAGAREQGSDSALRTQGLPAEPERLSFGTASPEVPGRGVPYATAHLPPRHTDTVETEPQPSRGRAGDRAPGRRAPVGNARPPAHSGRAALLALGLVLLFAVVIVLIG